MSPLDWAWVIIGLILQSMVVSAMLRGSFRRYPFLFAYLVFSILSTVVQFSFGYYFGRTSYAFVRAYWIGDFIGTCLVLFIIIHLIRVAMEGHPWRNPVYAGLLCGVVATAAGSVLLMQMFSRRFTLGRWMTEVGRDYYFSAVLLNAILWLVLMRRNRVNQQLFLLTSGLGLKLCGAAIAHALRLLDKPVWLASQFIVVTYLLSLYVWYVALRRLPEPEPVGQENFTASRL
jgi:hypothetical protein